jgi:hypothetical protein
VLTAPASAHSPPHGQRLLWASEAAEALPLVVTNRGLVFADREDGGVLYSLRCSEGFDASPSDIMSVFFVPDGSLAVGIYSGVYVTPDRGCTLDLGSGLEGTSFSMAVGHPSMPGHLLTSSRTLQDQAQVFLSEDYGRSWTPHYQNVASSYYDALLIAPSDAQRVYAAGRRLDLAARKMYFLSSVSTDGGGSWKDTALEAETVPFAVHTRNADVVFAYQPTDSIKTVFDVLRSADRGVSYEPVLEGVSQPSAIAVSSDGKTLWLGIGGPGGLYRSTDDGMHFEQVLTDSVQAVTCLAQRGDRLWVCANLKPNTDGIWYSEDEGKSLQKFMVFPDVTEPTSCDGEAQALCAGPWLDFDREQHLLAGDAGVDGGAVDAGLGDAGVALDAGLADASAPVDEHDATSASPSPKKRESSGCQISRARTASERSGWLALLAPLWLIVRRRRKAAQPPL